MDENDALETDTESKDELESRKAQEVIGLLLQKPEDNSETLQQVNFSVVEKAVPDNSNSSVRVSVAASALNICHVSLTEAGMLLESGDIIQQSLGNASSSMHLEDNTPTFVQCYEPIDESDNGDVVAKFIDGQPVQLEDGTTAFIHTSPREGLQPVQLEDGTMAYLSQSTAELFNGEASTLDLENIASSEMSDGDGKSLDVKENYQSSSSRGLGKAFRCPYENCHRLYTTLHHLKVHERSHTGDRPFKCTIGDCGKAFATGYGLKSHTRVHTGETPYKCCDETCQKAFKTSGDLQKHVRTHTGERPFKCPYNGCDRAFTTSNIRKVHIRTHTGERPYKCEEEGCGRAFASATNYKNHIRIHTGEKPYVCNVTGCNRRFTEYSSLYKHHVVHTHSKPYLCSLCGKTYRQISTLAMHKRTAHGVIEQNDSDLILTAEEKPSESEISEPETSEPKIKIENSKSLKIQDDCVVKKKDHKSVLKTNSGSSGSSSANSSISKNLPTIVTLQSDHSNQVLHEQPLYALQVTEDGSTTMQQIVLVTDPAQIAAFQQLAQQGQLNAVIASADDSSVSENT